MRALSIVALIAAIAAFCMLAASCSKQQTDTPGGPDVAPAGPAGPGPGEATGPANEGTGAEGSDAEEEAATEAEPTEGESPEDAQAVVDEVGAPLFEGAAAGSVETEEDTTKAIYFTDAEYDEVRDFYLEELKEPDWTNNGFEAGPFGGDTWEFKNADGSKLVTIDSESEQGNTEITFTVRPAEE